VDSYQRIKERGAVECLALDPWIGGLELLTCTPAYTASRRAAWGERRRRSLTDCSARAASGSQNRNCKGCVRDLDAWLPPMPFCFISMDPAECRRD
jgi:hypothetical protein